MTEEAPLTLNAKQLAEKLNVSRGTIYRLTKLGKLRPLNHLLKRNRLFNYQEVLDLISKR